MGEREWISRYFRPLAVARGAASLADDVAELTTGNARNIVTVDALVEGVHFLPSDPIEGIARKLVRCNVSDILSKGATPCEALLVVGWPGNRGEAELAAFAEALGTELASWGAGLIGGDTTACPGGLFLSLTLTGQCGPDGPVRRSGARAGDMLWLTGEIGAACRGFHALQAGRAGDPWVPAYREPRLPPIAAAGLVRAHATAAMDVSDGLLGDARALAAASGLALDLELDSVPFAGGSSSLEEGLKLATWGDDYQILFAAPPAAADRIRADAGASGVAVTPIGAFSPGAGLTVRQAGRNVNLPETLRFEHG